MNNFTKILPIYAATMIPLGYGLYKQNQIIENHFNKERESDLKMLDDIRNIHNKLNDELINKLNNNK